VQNVFTRSLESGDRQKAMKRLRVPPLGEKVDTIIHCVTGGSADTLWNGFDSV